MAHSKKKFNSQQPKALVIKKSITLATPNEINVKRDFKYERRENKQ